uniref:Uncharacterized protein n=1 Tax=Cannabis sativa TaxID=3483 RepID=A0A803Q2Y8_CANSA
MEDQGEVFLDTSSEAKHEEGAARRLSFGGFNKEGQPMSEAGEVLKAGEDYITEEYIEAISLRRQGTLRDWWVSPPSVVTRAKMKNSLKHGWGEPSPHDTSWLFNLKSSSKQNRLGYFYFSQFKEKWLTGTTNTVVSKLGNFVDEYYFFQGMDTVHTSFQQVPSYYLSPFTLGLKRRAQKILQLPDTAWNITLLAIEANFVKYKLYLADFMPRAVKKANKVKPDQEDVIEQEKSSKKRKKAPPSNQAPAERSIRENAFAYMQGILTFICSSSDVPYIIFAFNFLVFFICKYQKVFQALKKSGAPTQRASKSKGAKGGSSNGPSPIKSSNSAIMLSSEAKKGKEMHQYYLDRLLPEEVDTVRVELGEVNKKILDANKWIEGLTKEIKEMPSTAQLEAENEALSKELNELKDEREGLRTLLSKLTKDKRRGRQI